MRHRDLKFTGVQFAHDTDLNPPCFAFIVVDVLAIDAYAECRDHSIEDGRPLIELHLRNGDLLYVVDITLEQVGQLRRAAHGKERNIAAITLN